MECPKCGHLQTDGPAECAKCGLIFARWVERRSAVPRPSRPITRPPAPADEPAGAKVSPLGLLLGCTGILFLSLASWHFWFAGGLPVEREAYRDEGAGFALTLPAGWSLLTPATAQAALEKADGRFPEAVELALHNGLTVAAFFLPEERGPFAPWGIVTPVDGIPPPMEKESPATLAAVAGQALAGTLPGYLPGRGAVGSIDRLTAFRMEGTDRVDYLKSPSQEVFGELPGGGRYPIGRTEDVWDTFDRSLVHWLVPGRDRSFVLAFGCPADSMTVHARTFDQIMDSFRVLDRPPLYGYAATPALRAAATVLLVGVLLYTLTEAAALRRRR